MSNFDARPQVLTVPPAHERQIPATSSETSAVNPWPLALLARNLKAHIEKVPQLWVEAQVVSLNNRRGSVFIDLKDLEADATFSLALFGRRRLQHRQRRGAGRACGGAGETKFLGS